MGSTSVPVDDPLVRAAAAYAAGAHFGQTRKGGAHLDYFTHHLQPVAELVAGAGGDPVQVAAAYLHDTAEDRGGRARLDHVAEWFGDEVATIVHELSDSLAADDTAKPPWAERKAAYVEAIKRHAPRTLVVAAADKLHNATSIRDDLVAHGDELWARFSVSDPAAHCWYYGSLADVILARLGRHPLAVELDAVVDDLAARCGLRRPVALPDPVR